MDTKELEKFCPWARVRLIDEVCQRCYAYGLDDAGREEFNRDATIVKGTVLSALERSQRSELYRRIEQDGYARFCEEMAYTWFNRFAAIRYMEVQGYLSCGVRMLSSYCETSEYDVFSPDCLRMPTELDLPGLDRDRVFDLVAEADDEALFRLILVAQMNELAECLPTIFGRVGTADALLLPTRLLDRGEEGVLRALVERVKRDAWENVESLGWMYQFYNSEVKDAFFKSKAKETPDTIGPATQLFTPNWIVRYMVQNSLGRLWMLNNPGSSLRDDMKYYIEPDADHEDFIRIDGPEDISLCDPACGSGHILVYAFELLTKMYLEREYRMRDIPGLILSKNLHGMEIDPRAAQIAGLALAMCAREMDRRFFSRGVQADIAVLEPVVLEEDDIPQGAALAKKKGLVDALAHLDEVGSLLAPSEGDLAALHGAIELTSAEGLFDGSSKNKLECALKTCEVLARRHDCVVANPPYMGSSSFGPFMSKWVKKNYPDVKSDLFSSFVVRMFGLAKDHGECGVMSPFVWMFIGSYEKLRNEIIDSRTLTSLIQLEYSGFAGATVPICTYTFHNSFIKGYKGGYVRLSDFVGAAAQAPNALEAIKNPDCGWFYRRNAETFKQIPGTPIAYWASDGLLSAFSLANSISDFSDYTGSQNKTGDNNLYLRLFWEVSARSVGHKGSWATYSKGGDFRRWFGNLHWLVSIKKDAIEFYRSNPTSNLLASKYWYSEGICYTMLTSGKPSFRLLPPTGGFDMAGPCICGLGPNRNWALGFLNCSIAADVLNMLNPTLNMQARDIKSLPMLISDEYKPVVNGLVDSSVSISKIDWDSFETSWDFKRHPLL